MKKLSAVLFIAVCLAPCAVVWPQPEAVRENPPAPALTPTVSDPEPPVAELKTKVEAAPQAEKEKAGIPEQEPWP